MSCPCGQPPDRDIGFGSVRVVRASGRGEAAGGREGGGLLIAGLQGPKKCRVPGPSEAHFP